jgi:pseudaminic acid synthase
MQLVEAAAQAGAHAVKVQTYTPDTLTFRSSQAPFIIENQALWEGKTLWDLYQQAYTPWEWQPGMKQLAESLGLDFIASVFDFSSVDFWEEHGLSTYKIASPELVDLPLLEAVAATGKPVLLSTGMGSLDEITEAVQTLREANPDIPLTLLKCSSAYPAPLESMNLRAIRTLREHFQTPVGLSDHSTCHEVAVAALAMGASVFEKHLKLDDGQPTLDEAFSLTPDEFHEWGMRLRHAWEALGSETLGPSEAETGTLAFRKSLFVIKAIPAGGRITPDNLRIIRPANGMHPRHYWEVIGSKAACAIPAGTALESLMLRK